MTQRSTDVLISAVDPQALMKIGFTDSAVPG